MGAQISIPQWSNLLVTQVKTLNRSGKAVSVAIVNAVADANGVEPLELDIVLEEYIDVESVRQLMAHESSNWTLSFELPENTVTITGNGYIRVDGDHQGSVA